VRPRCSLSQRSPQASLENILIIIKGTRFEMMKNVPAEKKLINASVMMERYFYFPQNSSLRGFLLICKAETKHLLVYFSFFSFLFAVFFMT